MTHQAETATWLCFHRLGAVCQNKFGILPVSFGAIAILARLFLRAGRILVLFVHRSVDDIVSYLEQQGHLRLRKDLAFAPVELDKLRHVLRVDVDRLSRDLRYL